MELVPGQRAPSQPRAVFQDPAALASKRYWASKSEEMACTVAMCNNIVGGVNFKPHSFLELSLLKLHLVLV